VSETLQGLTEAGVLRTSEALGEPDWLRDRRLEAYKVFADLPWPTVRDEDWRHTNPNRLGLDRGLVAAGAATDGVAPLTTGIVGAQPETFTGQVRIVDGGVAEVALSEQATAHGVVVGELSAAAASHADLVRAHLGQVVPADEKFAALNLAAFTGGVLVHVPADVELDAPIAVTIQVATDAAVLPRLLVVAGPHSRLQLYVDHAGGAAATVVEVIEVVVGEGARVDLVTAQDWDDTVDHVAAHTGLVGANAGYRHLEVTFGGRTVYIRPDVRLDHPGGAAELLGVYFTDEGQHVQHRSLIHHNASHTTSDLVYKGALQGKSKATFFGNIRIEPHARATASDQTNRNLILSDGAKADSIPFLEIFNSDVVRCGHHSSVGQVDEMQLFYLESRGIPREEAARLLLFGFFAEVTDRFDLPGVRQVVLGEIDREVARSPVTMDPRRSSAGER
jgi:Fe-S cluster assembly protein SufD